MEEIAFRADIFTLDGVAGSKREYLLRLLAASATPTTDPESERRTLTERSAFA
jgi:hypothetical protein